LPGSGDRFRQVATRYRGAGAQAAGWPSPEAVPRDSERRGTPGLGAEGSPRRARDTPRVRGLRAAARVRLRGRARPRSWKACGEAVEPTLRAVGSEAAASGRILTLCSEDGGGSAVAALEEKERWRELGWQVDLWRTPAIRDRFDAARRPANHSGRRARLAEVDRGRAWLAEHARRPYDLLSAHYAWPHGGRALRWAAAMGQVAGARPAVWITFHGTDALMARCTERRLPLLQRWTSLADRVSWSSPRLRGLAAIAERVVDRSQIHHNYTTEVSQRSQRPALDRRAQHFAFTGHLTAIKDPLTALRAYAQLDLSTPSELHFFGRGPLEGILERRAKDLPKGRRARFHGALPRRDLLAWLPHFDLAIACSRFESFGLAALEAVAAGVPLVALAGRGYEAWLPPELQVPSPPPDAASELRDEALARAWSGWASDPFGRRRWAERQRAAAAPFLGLERARERCAEQAALLLARRASNPPAAPADRNAGRGN
jgi:glycosyltransferase involved in cell wall biosynthesis